MSGRRKCPKEPKIRNNPFGLGTKYIEWILKRKLKDVIAKNQKLTIICAGEVGSGKSVLMLNTWLLLEDEIDYRRMGYDDMSYVMKAYGAARDISEKGVKGVFFGIDELKVYRRRAMSTANNDFIDLLRTIRGRNMITFANAPSVKSIDSDIVEEKLFDALIFVHEAQSRFLFFSYDGFMNLYKDQGNIKYHTIQQHGPYYALFDTYFYDAPPEVYKVYNEHKKRGMKATEDRLTTKYAEGAVYTKAVVARKLKINIGTLTSTIERMLEKKLLKMEEIQHPSTGYYSFNDKDIEKIKKFRVRVPK
jgi:hypothetical protein